MSLTWGLSLCAQQAPALAFPAALLLGLALVVQLLAAGEGEFELSAAFLVEIELQRHEGHTFTLHRPDQLVDLPPMEQELAQPFRVMIEATALQVFGDVGVD